MFSFLFLVFISGANATLKLLTYINECTPIIVIGVKLWFVCVICEAGRSVVVSCYCRNESKVLAASRQVGHTSSVDQHCTLVVYMSTPKPLTHRNCHKHVHTQPKTHKQHLTHTPFVCFCLFTWNVFPTKIHLASQGLDLDIFLDYFLSHLIEYEHCV